MSDDVCNRCRARYRGDHECPEDGAEMLQRIRRLEGEVADLRLWIQGLVTRIDALEDAQPALHKRSDT